MGRRSSPPALAPVPAKMCATGKPPEIVSWVVEELTAPRDWWRWHFAGKAMQGILSGRKDPLADMKVDALLRDSIVIADALIAKLQEEAPK